MSKTLLNNRYTRSKPLGSGGMADVYLAHDEVLDRDVALKVLKDEYAENEEFVNRFRREARSAASLNHPNIVSIYDRGRAEDGSYYIAMEYVSGGTLKDRISRDGVLDPGAASEIALQIANALSVAHQNEVIHRDIKSRNILLTEAGYAKVNDFGIARAGTATTTTSRPSRVLGTAGYISPEQAMGKPVDPRSDLYSLGVVLYEMLTGTLPYHGEGPTSTSLKHVHEPPRSPRETNPNVPEPLNALTLKLLAKDPDDRYTSAAELAKDLARLQSGLSPLAIDKERMAVEEGTALLLPPGERRTKSAAIHPLAPTPVMEVFKSGRRRRPRLLRPLAALVIGVIVLGGLAWASTQDYGASEASGSEDTSGGEEATPLTAQVPELDYASEAEDALTDAVPQLENLNESLNTPVGAVVEEEPPAQTTVEESTPVDIAVSTEPKQDLSAGEAAPASADAGSQQAPVMKAVSSTTASPKQAPTPAQAIPQAPPAGADTASRQAPNAQRASTTAPTASVSFSVHDKPEQKKQEGKKKK